ncbi:TPA: DNA-binding protein [Streptococcus equi subsp. zooepidemicus]|uniref:DNA-binding protein n=1 Tax=Streptococcus equi TaxID=1336 RepID=UPI0006598581|nr:DNA-binding protein [Streptococcus equi]MCD3398387.1 DNA-binding protein [Streptococcus equi subsp. zooepidemicus]MCD3450588.1 DNA-binding protein [Streptococcus equi subsp. zooepidemicus]MCD3464556.1 DNA-binding protein [Streptococcus equi subsp. zooepidemicus]QUF62911.1 DNA-binding protein [Streptococcus equi subsp. zooepidemicus]CRQ99697.1 DNA-binding phage protein [Streptococcus equi subsp. equi]
MDSRLLQMLDEFEAGLIDRKIKVMGIINSETEAFKLELNKKQVSEMLGVDPKTFDVRFNSLKDFPRIETGGREKYPRDVVIEWYRKNWERTGIKA